MSIITENRYLDECTFSSGTIRDDDCKSIALWTTDGDTGTGVSSDATFDNRSCFKMDSVVAGAGNLASRTLDVGTYQTNPNVVSIKLYHDVLGTLANADYFELILQATNYRCSIRFCSDGLYVYDGASWNEVGVNLVTTDSWQEWTFSWTQQEAGKVNVYLDGVLKSSEVDCSDSTIGTTGTTTMRQYGTTVIGLTYIDWFKAGNAFRYGGETWIMQEGAQFTVRTDTRWHTNAPASMAGTFGSQTVTEGKLIYDGTKVKWLAYASGGTDNIVPAIGTSITQGAVTGTLLGVYGSITAPPSSAGYTMPENGFIKFREVTGGTFSKGGLTGIPASGTGADVTGWIEIVSDSTSTITVPRLGEHRISGSWFYLDDTTGVVGQTLQVPTNGGGATTYCPGVWIETGVATDEYEHWSSLNGTTNGWDKRYIGAPSGGTDARQNFVKDIGNGQMQIGEAVDLLCTYANIAAQASTYAAIAHSSTYKVVGNVCTITYTTGHLLQTGHIVGVEFTSGGASALSANFTITVIDAYRYSFALVTDDTSGNCTARPGLAVSLASNGLGLGDIVYCDFTTGTGVDGEYEIYAIASTTIYYIKYPATSAVTGGNVSVYSRYIITYTGASASDFMNLTAGNRVYLDFTSGAGVNGIYTIIYPTVVPVVQASTYTWTGDVVTVTFTAHGRKIGDKVYVDFTSGGGTASDGIYTIVSVAANTFTFALAGSGAAGNCSVYHASFDVIANNGAAGDSGNVTVKMTIGSVPIAGCKTRIPNIFLREADTASRASNKVHATIASRPEWDTTSAGAIDIQNAYSTWYHNYSQPYSVRLKYLSYYDAMIISECASALDLDDVHSSMNGALDVVPLTLTSNFAGGTIKNSKFQRGNTPGSTDHAINMSYCIDTIFDNVTGGIIQMARSSGYAIAISYGSNITLTDFKAINNSIWLSAVNGATITDADYTDTYIGYGKVYSAAYGISLAAGCVDILVEGMTLGFGGTIPNVHPPGALVHSAGGTDITVRNIGTKISPIPAGTFRWNLYGMAYAISTGGNNYNIRYQRIYVDNNIRTGLILTINSDKLVKLENISGGRYVNSAMAIHLQLDSGLNSLMHGVVTGADSVAANLSVYGTHFKDIFLGNTRGRYVLACNEPTSETSAYFTMVAGTQKFNSAGGILIGAVGDQAVWEDMYYRKGFTAFENTTPTMTGGTIGNYTLEYDIDINDGNGFTGSYQTLSGANLSIEPIDPEDGFKLKIRITTLTANLTAITFLRIDMVSTASAQEDNLYPLDEYEIELTGLQIGSEVRVYKGTNASNAVEIGGIESTTSSIFSLNHFYGGEDGYIVVFATGYQAWRYELTFPNSDTSIPVQQIYDRQYSNP